MKYSWALVFGLSTGMVACGGGGDDAAESFHAPSNAAQIKGSDLYITGGEAASLPTPSHTTSAPKITHVDAVQTGTYRFNVNLTVEGAADIAYTYLDFGAGGTFRVKPLAIAAAGGADLPITACGIAASSQGIVCTSACLTACSCLECSDSTVENNAEQACAFTCTVNDNLGNLESAPYNGSEKNFADILYNGDPEIGLPGIAAQSGCTAGKCSVPKPSQTTTRTKGWSIQFESPTIPELTPLFAPTVVTIDTPEVSEPFAAAKIGVNSRSLEK